MVIARNSVAGNHVRFLWRVRQRMDCAACRPRGSDSDVVAHFLEQILKSLGAAQNKLLVADHVDIVSIASANGTHGSTYASINPGS